MLVEIETADSVIPLEFGGGGHNNDKRTFDSSWDAEEPLDVTKIMAVIINGTRISVR